MSQERSQSWFDHRITRDSIGYRGVMSVLDVELRECFFQELKTDGFLQKCCTTRVPKIIKMKIKIKIKMNEMLEKNICM